MVEAVKQAAQAAVATPAFAALAVAIAGTRDGPGVAAAFIDAKYAALGGASGPLGPATSGLGTCPDGAGYFHHYRNGSIYWHPTSGAHDVRGPVRDKWAALGWENSFLGFPTTDELVTPNGQGRFNAFQGGSVYWSPTTGAHSIGGAIRDLWGRTGFENSPLGFPTTNEFPIPGGRAQDFQYGSIRWTPATGAVVVGAPRAGGGTVPLGVSPPGTQLVTVVASRPGATVATLVAWEKRAAGWTPVLGPLTAQIGSLGVGIASESTTRTPAGTFPLTEAFGRQANPGTALPYRVVDGNDWWVSDVGSARYNQYYRCAPGTCPFAEAAGERLAAAGAVYDHAVVIDYNRAGVRGAGSAFFLHISNNSPTAGCVAIGAGSLQQLMRWLAPAARPVIAIGIG